MISGNSVVYKFTPYNDDGVMDVSEYNVTAYFSFNGKKWSRNCEVVNGEIIVRINGSEINESGVLKFYLTISDEDNTFYSDFMRKPVL